MKPIYCAETGSLNPNDIPITAKKVPAGVPEITSTITRRPEIAHAPMKPARVQYSINLADPLLDQTFVVGIGNKYNSEILFLQKI